MKKRIFTDMADSVFRVMINTEDWSFGDIDLMVQFGEPEIDVGGDIEYVFDGDTKTKTLGSELVRIVHGFPYARCFDSRDYSSYNEAVAVGLAWKDEILRRIDDSIVSLRNSVPVVPTEEVSII